jgi:hypothetical protein
LTEEDGFVWDMSHRGNDRIRKAGLINTILKETGAKI